MSKHAIATRRQALRLLGTASAGLGAFSSSLARAQSEEPVGGDVDLHLALAVDVSGSVNSVRFDLQKQGYAQAFANREVLRAVNSGPKGAIAVSMYEWTGPELSMPVIPWTKIADARSMDSLARDVAGMRRHLYGGGTSISSAIDFGAMLFSLSPFKGGRRVIDISGDGANNGGRLPAVARDAAVAAGININGLPIIEVEPDLADHYRNQVIGGAGAFVVVAERFEDFSGAILRKLIQEIAWAPGLSPRQA